MDMASKQKQLGIKKYSERSVCLVADICRVPWYVCDD